MKVLYDYQIFYAQKFGGISRYFFEIVNCFERTRSVDYNLSIKMSNNEYIKLLDSFKSVVNKSFDYRSFLPKKNFKGKYRIENFISNNNINLNKEITIKNIKIGDFDIFHPTYYDDYFFKYLGNKPFVLTIHDMIHEIYPEYFLSDNTSVLKKSLASKADHIIAVSEKTKKDIIDILGISEDKITVIYHGNSLKNDFTNNDFISHQKVPKKYLLYVGTRDIYKNFYFFLQAVTNILHNDKDLNILCTGRSFSNLELKFFSSIGISSRIQHFYADDNFLHYLYKNAEAFIFPSLYEGFGIPILEAFSSGCPVICSFTSSLPEVAGKAAVYFHPKELKSIEQAIKDVIYDNQIRSNLISNGYEQLKNFSWDKAALETQMVYQKVLNKK